jgi:hypothetical protein
MTRQKEVAKAHRGQLEPRLMSKLKAMESMPRTKFLQAWKTLETDVLVWAALIHAKNSRMLRSKNWSEINRFIAKLAAEDLRGFRDLIADAAERRSKQFFISLGRYLSGESKAETWDRLDVTIARMVLENPSISAKEAVRELERHGRISKSDAESVFRNRKKRLALNEMVGKHLGASGNRRLRKT